MECNEKVEVLLMFGRTFVDCNVETKLINIKEGGMGRAGPGKFIKVTKLLK